MIFQLLLNFQTAQIVKISKNRNKFVFKNTYSIDYSIHTYLKKEKYTIKLYVELKKKIKFVKYTFKINLNMISILLKITTLLSTNQKFPILLSNEE